MPNFVNVVINIENNDRVEKVFSLNINTLITQNGVCNLVSVLWCMLHDFRRDRDITLTVMMISQYISKNFKGAIEIEEARACPIKVAEDFYEWFSGDDVDVSVVIRDTKNPMSSLIRKRTDENGFFKVRISEPESCVVLIDALVG